MLEKEAEKCTSMSVAVPLASIYTPFMYKSIAKCKREGGFKLARVQIPPKSGLRFKIGKWLEVRTRLNGAAWNDSLHHALQMTGATDASSRA